MKIEFHTLHWNNIPKEQIDAHKMVMDYFDLPINYHNENVNHGLWMDRVFQQSDSDLIVIFDVDCVPVSKQKVMDCIRYVKNSKSFLGLAMVANHIPPKSHIYAGGVFYVVARECWEKLGRPSFTETRRGDTTEEFTYRAEEAGVRYRCLFPTTFEREPVEGIWPLAGYGYYGIGTTYDDTVYHLFQSRIGNNMDLFVKRCHEIVDGTFDNSTHINARTYDYKGKIVP